MAISIGTGLNTAIGRIRTEMCETEEIKCQSYKNCFLPH